MDRLGELARLARGPASRSRIQTRSAYGAYARPRAIAASTPPRTRKKPSGRALAGEERAVALVDVARQQRRRVGVGAGDDERRHAEHVGREPRRQQRADELAGRDEHLAAEVAALLLGRELILEVDGRRARLDHPLHQLERVQRPAEAGLRVGDDRERASRCRRLPSAHSIWSARSSALFSRRTIAGTLFAG